MVESITSGIMVGLLLHSKKIRTDTRIFFDSCWEHDLTEINMIFYNPKENILALTGTGGAGDYYKDDEICELLWSYPDIK